ncbi:TatD family hydrolase [Cohnella thailandensis]|uniref:TatD family hydrolase n=1 Tax=Cohnella thailandensis TaxID=557557 RepID=A0A841T1X7_9BACL|nr:TatD family hydrolase [Cohnella thailandensis]MBP1973542.1 TatD DNase family protein [Cohnella thailandensis]
MDNLDRDKLFKIYDAHIHLDSYPAERRDSLLAEAAVEGVAGIVAVSMDLASCEENRRLARLYPGMVLPAYGRHPEQPALDPDGPELTRLCDWIRARAAEDEPFAIGEVGLPYYLRTETEGRGESFDEAPYLLQLERFVGLAAELNRPIVLHAVYEDADKALDLLEKHRVREAHFHWFKGAASTVERMARYGCYVSFTPDVLYEPDIRELASSYPLERIMAETDGPWPFEGPFAGRETVPSMARDVVREIALLRGMSEEEAGERLAENTRRFYRWFGASRASDFIR